MKTNWIAILLTFFLLWLNESCRKKIEAGINTTVTGIAFDDNTQKPISNGLVTIIELGYGQYGLVPKAVLDSTITAADGKFNITFTTTGEGALYEIGFQPKGNYYSYEQPIYIPVGKDTAVRFSAFEVHNLKIRVQLVDNPRPPLAIGTLNKYTGLAYGTNNDTSILLKVIPNKVNEITFSIVNPDTTTLYNYRKDTINCTGFADTFYRTYRIEPKLLPKRG